MFANLAPLTPNAEPKPAFLAFSDGLDLETPGWSAPPGRVRDALNYEISVEDGYQDVTGYERFDGRPAPSEASFTILDVTVTGSVEVGDTVTGAVTTATGVVIAIATYPDDATQTYLVLTKVTGTFSNASENLTVSAVVEANTDAVGYANSAPTSKLAAQYKNLAADEYRSDITTVPGEGSVWGGFSLGDTKYAIRNAVGGATAVLHRDTAAGWTAVSLGREIAFTSGGTTEISEGDTIEGGTSGATATVERIQLQSGTWAGGDAAGWFTLSGQTGTFQAENLDVGASANLATIAGDSAAITLQPDGTLDWDRSNFANPQGSERIYGADGVNFGFEFDGTVLARIRTGMTDDTPDHVIVHKRQLFFAFDGSVQHSGLGDPMSWSVVLGASEIATESPVTGFQVEPGAEGNAALLIACRQRLYFLYGNAVSDWNLVRYRKKVGAYEWTLQQLAYTLFLDDRGITDLRTVQAFGNFDHSAMSKRIRSLINSKRLLSRASCVVRDKNQYRLFFSDKTAIYVTMEGAKPRGMMPITLEHQPVVLWSEENSSGKEEVFFGADNGYVYQMEKGTSFDGENIYAYLYTHYDHGKTIEVTKHYYAPVTIEGKNSGYAEFDLGYLLSYGEGATFQPDNQTAELAGATSDTWDSGLTWDTGIVWDDSVTVPTSGIDLRGEGRNIGWVITKNSDYFSPVLLTGIHYRYLPTVSRRG